MRWWGILLLEWIKVAYQRNILSVRKITPKAGYGAVTRVGDRKRTKDSLMLPWNNLCVFALGFLEVTRVPKDRIQRIYGSPTQGYQIWHKSRGRPTHFWSSSWSFRFALDILSSLNSEEQTKIRAEDTKQCVVLSTYWNQLLSILNMWNVWKLFILNAIYKISH